MCSNVYKMPFDRTVLIVFYIFLLYFLCFTKIWVLMLGGVRSVNHCKSNAKRVSFVQIPLGFVTGSLPHYLTKPFAEAPAIAAAPYKCFSVPAAQPASAR